MAIFMNSGPAAVLYPLGAIDHVADDVNMTDNAPSVSITTTTPVAGNDTTTTTTTTPFAVSNNNSNNHNNPTHLSSHHYPRRQPSSLLQMSRATHTSCRRLSSNDERPTFTNPSHKRSRGAEDEDDGNDDDDGDGDNGNIQTASHQPHDAAIVNASSMTAAQVAGNGTIHLNNVPSSNHQPIRPRSKKLEIDNSLLATGTSTTNGNGNGTGPGTALAMGNCNGNGNSTGHHNHHHHQHHHHHHHHQHQHPPQRRAHDGHVATITEPLIAQEGWPIESPHFSEERIHFALGVGWRYLPVRPGDIGGDIDFVAATRGWERFIEKHYERVIGRARIFLERSEEGGMYLVAATPPGARRVGERVREQGVLAARYVEGEKERLAKGMGMGMGATTQHPAFFDATEDGDDEIAFYLFRNDLSCARLVGASWGECVHNLNQRPIRFPEGSVELVAREPSLSIQQQQQQQQQHQVSSSWTTATNGASADGVDTGDHMDIDVDATNN